VGGRLDKAAMFEVGKLNSSLLVPRGQTIYPTSPSNRPYQPRSILSFTGKQLALETTPAGRRLAAMYSSHGMPPRRFTFPTQIYGANLLQTDA